MCVLQGVASQFYLGGWGIDELQFNTNPSWLFFMSFKLLWLVVLDDQNLKKNMAYFISKGVVNINLDPFLASL